MDGPGLGASFFWATVPCMIPTISALRKVGTCGSALPAGDGLDAERRAASSSTLAARATAPEFFNIALGPRSPARATTTLDQRWSSGLVSLPLLTPPSSPGSETVPSDNDLYM